MMILPGPNNIPIIIPTSSGGSSKPAPEPKCPHCKKVLKGWTKPSKGSIWEDVIGVGLCILVISNLIAALVGGMDGTLDPCHSFGDKRYDYVIPSSVLTCQSVRWLSNKEFITEKDHKASWEKR